MKPSRVLALCLLSLGLPLAVGAAADDTFRVNFGTGPLELDPAQAQTVAEAQIFPALYEGLVVYDPQSLRPLPGVAQGWRWSNDGLVLTFQLRPGVTFENGQAVNAETFRDSWVRLLDPRARAPYASLLDAVVGARDWRLGRLRDGAQLGIQALDDLTLEIRFVEPSPHFLALICHYAFLPVAPSWNPAEGAPAPANGPYRLTSLTATLWVLEKNPDYWDAANVAFERLEFSFDDDAVAVTRRYKEGLLDWVVSGIDNNATLGLRYYNANALFGSSFLYLRPTPGAWADPRVRRALILLLPLEELRRDYVQPTSVLVPPYQGYPQVQGLAKQDREAALALLAEAGYPGGQGLPPLTVAFPKDQVNDRFLEVFHQGWDEIGLEIREVRVAPPYYSRVGQIAHDLGYYNWIGDFLDPVTFLELWKSSSSLNVFGFDDPAFDQLLAEAARKAGEDRLKTLADAETALLQGGLLIPLGHTPGFNLIDREEIGGWYQNALDIHPFKNLYRQDPPPLKNLVRFDLLEKP